MLVNLGGGGIALPELTSPGSANDLLNGKQLIDQNGEIVTGTIPSLGTKNYTPSSRNQTIQSGQYLSGAQTILGDSNLVSSNIKSGVNIFGVQGNYSGSLKDGKFDGSMLSLYGGMQNIDWISIQFPVQADKIIAFDLRLKTTEEAGYNTMGHLIALPQSTFEGEVDYSIISALAAYSGMNNQRYYNFQVYNNNTLRSLAGINFTNTFITDFSEVYGVYFYLE